MAPIDWKNVWQFTRTYLLNKYVITVIVFVLIFLFVGDQSLIKDMQRSRQIRQTERAIQKSERAIQEANHKKIALQQMDSLEQYAREQYLMHKSNEDVYLVEE
ncbi:MAG: septum formation initiator family protein [Paludibacteraceae bacterium]|nr:septum formation initiator family protein [Paludibacteraceae bacterium]